MQASSPETDTVIPLRLEVQPHTLPLKMPFRIARGVREHITVLRVALHSASGAVGEAECHPLARYNQHPAQVADDIEALRDALAAGLSRRELQTRLAAGPARNALDAALWDLHAPIDPQAYQVDGALTLSLDAATAMAQAAKEAVQGHPARVLKVKLGEGAHADADKLRAIRHAAPQARLIVDANESLNPASYDALLPTLTETGIAMLEQPFAAGQDDALANLPRPVPVFADESIHSRAELAQVAGRYDGINIKLDKSGGLTEALALAQAARDGGLEVMVGCMLGSALAMRPAHALVPYASWVDLDGPEWLR